MKLGEFEVPQMDVLKAAFGADLSDYPPEDMIPEEHRLHRSKGCEVFSSLFFNGGKLSDHGLELKQDVSKDDFYQTLRAYMCSFAPKHEIKEATCGWLIDECTHPQTVD